jgi:hypothetical protein
MYLKETRWEGEGWTHLVQDTNQWQALLNVMIVVLAS